MNYLLSLPLVIACALALNARAAPVLELDEALSLAESRSQLLAAQRSAVASATALIAPAGELPDPKLFFGVENMPSAGDYAGSTTWDAMTMRRVGLMQEYVRGDKRKARSDKASADSVREAALLEMQRAELRRDVALAWLDRHYAERGRRILRELIAESELQSTAASAALTAGRSGAAESIAARSLRGAVADRMRDIERQARRATALLARWIGEEAERTPGETPVIARLPRSVRMIEVDPDMHPDHAVFAPMEAAAQAEVRLAKAATQPDWSVELSWAKRGGEYSPNPHGFGDPVRTNPNTVSIMFRVDLPLFGARRQDPVVVSKTRALDQVRAQAEDARRKHVADVRASLIDWETGIERLSRHRGELVPLAEERARSSLAAYEGGRMDLSAVLDARRSVLEARLTALAVEAELARSWAQLAFLIPERTAQ